MKYLILSLTLTVAIYSQAQSDSKFRLQGQVKGLKKSKLTLLYYKTGRPMPIDTAETDDKGYFVFSSNDSIPVSLGIITGLGLNVILDNKNISFTADMKNLLGTAKFKNSPENTVFFTYNRRFQELVSSLQSKMMSANNSGFSVAQPIQPSQNQRLAYEKEYQKLTKRLTDSLYTKHPKMFCTRFLKSFEDPKLPTLPIKNPQRADSIYLTKYRIEHFLDNSFVSDQRIAHTMSVPMRAMRLMSEIPAYISLSELKPSYEKLIALTKDNTEMRKILISIITQKYEFTNNTAADSLYAFFVSKYIRGEPNLWEASVFQQINEIQNGKNRMALGNIFPDIFQFATYDNKPFRLVEVPALYTVLFFYDPNCSACKQQAPMLVTFGKKMLENNKNIATCAITVNATTKDWLSFIQQFRTAESIINLKTTVENPDFQKIGIYKLPSIFIIDNNGRIVARYVDAKDLEKVVDKLP
jgi:thiol-disulfide isomerase/thioredoxin